MDHSVYSPLKIFHHRDAIKRLREGEYSAPIRVQLVPTNVCNQNCQGCAYRTKGYSSNETFAPLDKLSWDKLQEIVRVCAEMGVKAIEITGGGEPTCHPHFLDLCEAILDAEIDLGVVTNGTLWSNRHTAVLSRCQWIRFSIDAGREETYVKYRNAYPLAYHQVRSHVRTMASVDGPLVGVGFVVNADNWREVSQAALNARGDGADNFRISALFQPQGADYFKDFYDWAKTLCKEAESLSTKEFRVFNLFGDRLRDLFANSPDYSECGYSKLTTYLGADYNAYSCCVRAYSKAGKLGSFRDQSFKQMWFSPETQGRVGSLDARRCPMCMYNSKNETIAYAINQDPLHVNFI